MEIWVRGTVFQTLEIERHSKNRVKGVVIAKIPRQAGK